jgi:homoserine O-acetyltransferase/O-succinyltransferase
MKLWFFLLLSFGLAAQNVVLPSSLAGYAEGTYTIKDFHFRSGEILPELHLSYVTIGTPLRDASGQVRNAVLMLHGTGGDHRFPFLQPGFVNSLYGVDEPLDLRKYYLILPDCLGHGKSSKPSDGLRAHFPKYRYEDMVVAEYRLVTEGLGIRHLRLITGDSMGGMHTWLWGVRYPEMMDGLLPMGSYPVEIAGRNRLWRKIIIEAIRSDPAWKNGDYNQQPPSLAVLESLEAVMTTSPVFLQTRSPTRDAMDAGYDRIVRAGFKNDDANDELYAYSASEDYNPGPELEKIRAKLLAINFADDEINPPELRTYDREMPRVKNGRFIIVPASDKTIGHSTTGHPEFWRDYLKDFLDSLGTEIPSHQ